LQTPSILIRLFPVTSETFAKLFSLSSVLSRLVQFVDGEAVILGVDGVPDFNALHSLKHDDEVQLIAFDILTLDGEDLRPLPSSLRKTNLARLLARRPFSCSPGTGALRRDRARERGGRAAAWSTIHAEPSSFHDSDVN